jgi:hypothetical protein
MKVIFLEIDGVLNCKETPNPRKFTYIVDKRLLARFRRLIERTGARWGVPFMDVTPDTHPSGHAA